MARRLFTLLSAVSLVLCFGSAAAWIRSYQPGDLWNVYPPGDGTYSSARGNVWCWWVISSRGRVQVIELADRNRVFVRDPARPRVEHKELGSNVLPPLPPIAAPPPPAPVGPPQPLGPELPPSPVTPTTTAPAASSRRRTANASWQTVPVQVQRVPITGILDGAGDQQRVTVSWWIPTLAGSILPAVWLRRHGRRRRWQGVGRCHNCGYDLRASPGRCPECGAGPKGVAA